MYLDLEGFNRVRASSNKDETLLALLVRDMYGHLFEVTNTCQKLFIEHKMGYLQLRKSLGSPVNEREKVLFDTIESNAIELLPPIIKVAEVEMTKEREMADKRGVALARTRNSIFHYATSESDVKHQRARMRHLAQKLTDEDRTFLNEREGKLEYGNFLNHARWMEFLNIYRNNLDLNARDTLKEIFATLEVILSILAPVKVYWEKCQTEWDASEEI
jgi:hypothetical protein